MRSKSSRTYKVDNLSSVENFFLHHRRLSRILCIFGINSYEIWKARKREKGRNDNRAEGFSYFDAEDGGPPSGMDMDTWLRVARERSMHETPANLYVNGARHKQRPVGGESREETLPGGLLEDT